jgi:hypothetical protein
LEKLEKIMLKQYHPYTISRSKCWRKNVIYVQALEKPERWTDLISKLYYDSSISIRLIDQAKACFVAYRKDLDTSS